MELGESIGTGSVCNCSESSGGEADMDTDDVSKPPSAKRRKYCGSATYSIPYQSHWETKYDFIARSSSRGHVYCKVCCKDVSIKHQGDFSMVCTFIERYPKVFTFTSKELDTVHEEFLDYQSMSKDEIPQHVWDEAVCHEHVGPGSKVAYHRMDRIWGHIADMKLPGMDTARFARLAKVAQLVLTIPHSNAGEEHVFSVIRKIRRDDRGKLQLEGTLSSLVSVKLNLPENKTQPATHLNCLKNSFKKLRKLRHITIKNCACPVKVSHLPDFYHKTLSHVSV